MRTQWHLIGFLGMALIAAQGAATTQAESAASKTAPKGSKVLIVMDERPQMGVLARYLLEHGAVESEIVDQKSIPENWTGYHAVIGYIHGKLEEKTELKIIDYTRSGGRFVCLHHMISSGKAKNRYYFDFLGVRMDGIEQSRQPAEPGGHYAWREEISQTIVNIESKHYISSHGVKWPASSDFSAPGMKPGTKSYPSFALEDSEV
jgi:hypothetical protein